MREKFEVVKLNFWKKTNINSTALGNLKKMITRSHAIIIIHNHTTFSLYLLRRTLDTFVIVLLNFYIKAQAGKNDSYYFFSSSPFSTAVLWNNVRYLIPMQAESKHEKDGMR